MSTVTEAEKLIEKQTAFFASFQADKPHEIWARRIYDGMTAAKTNAFNNVAMKLLRRDIVCFSYAHTCGRILTTVLE